MELSKDAIGLIGCAALIVLVFAGVRVYLAAALVGLVGVVAIIGWKAGAGIVGTIPHSKSVNYTLSVLPLFILIGYLAYYAGITQSLSMRRKQWMGWMPGGLAVATVFAVAAFSAVSGASTAAAAVFARVAIPEMLKAGYAKRLAAGVVVAAGGTLDALIPPSAVMVVYAIIIEASVGKLMHCRFHTRPDLGALLRLDHHRLEPVEAGPRAGRSPATHGASAARSVPGTHSRDRRHRDYLLRHVLRLGDAHGSRRAGRVRGLGAGAGQGHEVEDLQRRPAGDGQAHRDDLRDHLGHPDLRALPGLRRACRSISPNGYCR